MKRYFKITELDNGFVRLLAHPHTKDIEALESCCSGVETANYYFLCKYFNVDIPGEFVLTQLAALQDTDKSSDKYGCMRWYREEPCIRDTNGAFFVLKPLAAAMLICSDKLNVTEQNLIKEMLNKGLHWFKKECRDHGLFYPNKIVSDGALLSCIAHITNDESAKNDALTFWNKWLNYTKNYGWGWGENTSACYASIIIEALELAAASMKNESHIYIELIKLRNVLLNYMDFHDELEYIPSIRSYNFAGKIKNSYIVNYISQIITPSNLPGDTNYKKLSALILHQHSPEYIKDDNNENFRKEHIYANSYAYTYKGSNIRLGTISHFPVMPGCYQNSGWGLGWQSMPISVLAVNHGVSYLRYTAVSDKKLRTHPAYDKHSAYLSTALFSDENIPDISTVSYQDENIALIIRQISHIANKAESVADEWFVPGFSEDCEVYKGWFIINYGDCILAVKPLNNQAKSYVDQNGLHISQSIYSGEEKTLIIRKALTIWAVAVFDNTEDYKNRIEQVIAKVSNEQDLYIPREIPKYSIKCGSIEATYDPENY